MEKGSLIAGVAIVGGAYLLLQRPDIASALGVPPIGATGLDRLTPEQRARVAAAVQVNAAGNIPVAPSSSFAGTGLIGAIGGIGAAALPLLGLGGVALGITTAGIGFAVTFLTYELLKQRASMHTNDVRDAWTRQFIPLHDALGIRPLTVAQTQGSGPGDIEMAEVIFYFDHDPNNTLWKAATHTQDERVFRTAAGNIDRFLTAQGVPVVDVQ